MKPSYGLFLFFSVSFFFYFLFWKSTIVVIVTAAKSKSGTMHLKQHCVVLPLWNDTFKIICTIYWLVTERTAPLQQHARPGRGLYYCLRTRLSGPSLSFSPPLTTSSLVSQPLSLWTYEDLWASCKSRRSDQRHIVVHQLNQASYMLCQWPGVPFCLLQVNEW